MSNALILPLMSTQVKAHIGDALAALFSRILINEVISLTTKYHSYRHYTHAGRIVSNEHFTKTCVRFKLFNIAANEAVFYNHKKYGTLYEAHLYELYIEHGFDSAFTFFKNTAYKLYCELNEEMPLLTTNGIS